MSLFGPNMAVWPAIPEAWLALAACVILMMDVFGGHKHRGVTATATMFALLLGVVLISSFGMVLTRTLLFHGLYVADGLGTFLKLAGFVTMATAIFYSQEYLEQRSMLGGELLNPADLAADQAGPPTRFRSRSFPRVRASGTEAG